MKVRIDISLFSSPTESYGVIHGSIDLASTPRIGESISFLFPLNEKIRPLEGEWWPESLLVKNVTHAPVLAGASVLLALEPVVLESRNQCEAYAEYLENGFGLFVDVYVA